MNLTKYHGLGNDFIITHEDEVQNIDFKELAIKLCHRHSGIGADGLIIVKENPLEMIYFNSDGSRAEMCGNGIRCFANYCFDNDIVKNNSFTVSTLGGEYLVTINQEKPFSATVNMGQANYNPDSFGGIFDQEVIQKEIIVHNQTFTISSVLLGVPHTVLKVNNLAQVDMVKDGSLIEKSPYFKEGTNVNFVEILAKNHIKMQTFERGAGLTLACGTGACATFDILYQQGLLDDIITVSLPLGNLTLQKINNDIYMTGPATKIAGINVDWENVL